MCGIYGLALADGTADRRAIDRERDRLAHRGPDDSGTWLSADGRVALAHRRLAVIDLSPGGHQPMASADGAAVVTFNGEIYNYCELKRELETLGHRFATASDTEVLLAAWRQWGEGCLARFNGMFAFAIHDRGDAQTPPRLFFARDRAGEKPFYYAFDGRRFEFASELKAISARGGLDLAALNHYLALGYVPGDLCIAQGVKKLPAGHCGTLDLAAFRLTLTRYWRLPAQDANADADPEALAVQAQALLEDSVRLRLIADVPLGVLLSGGLDSSLVAAAAARASAHPIQTFTITLPGSPLDESRHARTVADFLGTEHHELPLAETGLGALAELAPLVDEPLADSSLIPAFLVSRLTREHVKVALGGDGGDELFGGYLDYARALADARRLGWLPAPWLRAAANAAAGLPAGVRGRNRLAGMHGGPLAQIVWGTPYFDRALRTRILTADARAALGSELTRPERDLETLFAAGRGAVDRMTRTHFGSILPDDFLTKVDRASMAVALEMRCPLLDHRLVEFAFARVPDAWKVEGGETRRLQKRLAQRMLPPDLDVNRKQGFSIPLDAWLRADDCTPVRAQLEALPPEIERREVDALIDGERRGRANGGRLYALVMLAHAARNLASA